MDGRKFLLLVSFLVVAERGKTLDICTPETGCSGGEICYRPPGEAIAALCLCPFGFTGDGCMTREDSTPESCPVPTNKVDYCVPTGECGIAGGDCNDGQVCCVGVDGCTFKCVTPGCSNPYDRKKCTDIRRLCTDDETDRGFSCYCPLGYNGENCNEVFQGVDKKCEFPKVHLDTCQEFEYPPSCTDSSSCSGGQICCSTGCKMECVDPPNESNAEQDSTASKSKLGIDSSIFGLILASSIFNKPKQSPTRIVRPPPVQPTPVRHPPVRHPASQTRPACDPFCNTNKCPTNVGAKCQNKRGTCDGYFYDQYTNQLITAKCLCATKPHPNCGDRWCYENGDKKRRPLICPGVPGAQCRISSCGGCYRYWTDRWGKLIKCG